MRRIEERYISLLTDFGFKRIFGTKPNKDLLINFLNSLFDGFQVIKDAALIIGRNVCRVALFSQAKTDKEQHDAQGAHRDTTTKPD